MARTSLAAQPAPAAARRPPSRAAPRGPSPGPSPGPSALAGSPGSPGAVEGPRSAATWRTGPPIIQAQGVSKVYESGRLRVEALRSVSLEVRAGEMVAVMGPSGCGKTTLLNCLSGLDDVNSGKVILEGRDLARMGDLERTRLRSRRMGFVFQSFNLLPVLTALENVELPLLVSGVRRAEAERRATEALAKVGLATFLDHKPRELSGGQQQRVTVARSLVNEPAIVWADEPTGNLDTQHSQGIVDLLHQLNRDLGQTYVIVTHDAAIAQGCHRIIHMESGAIRKVEPGLGRSLPLAQSRR